MNLWQFVCYVLGAFTAFLATVGFNPAPARVSLPALALLFLFLGLLAGMLLQ